MGSEMCIRDRLLVLQLKESGISDEEITNLLEDLAEEVSELNRKRE